MHHLHFVSRPERPIPPAHNPLADRTIQQIRCRLPKRKHLTSRSSYMSIDYLFSVIACGQTQQQGAAHSKNACRYELCRAVCSGAGSRHRGSHVVLSPVRGAHPTTFQKRIPGLPGRMGTAGGSKCWQRTAAWSSWLGTLSKPEACTASKSQMCREHTGTAGK